MQAIRSRINAARASVVGALSLVGASAHAALPTGVTESISTAQTDAVTVGGLVLAAIVAIFAFKLMRRAL